MRRFFPRARRSPRRNGRIPGVREFHAARTPFSLVYRIDIGDILVLRLIDNRAPRPDKIIP
jgi:hypothetical protein